MNIAEIESREYMSIMDDNYSIVYNDIRFLEINKWKIKQIHYYLFYDKKNRFILSLGEVEPNKYNNAFSSPFGLIEPIKTSWTIAELDGAIASLNTFFSPKDKISFTLPPPLYLENLVPYLFSALIRNGYNLVYQDLNFAIDLKKVKDNSYDSLLYKNARKNLRISKGEGLKFVLCDNEKMNKCAYAIIAKNRKSRGYPLRMTWEQVKSTIEIVPHELFLVGKNDDMIAAALIYHVTKDVAQVIYWGSLIECNYLKPVNFLAYNLVNYYMLKGFKFLDIGPSTEKGIPNYGLCDFKMSIGCSVSSKFTLCNYS